MCIHRDTVLLHVHNSIIEWLFMYHGTDVLRSKHPGALGSGIAGPLKSLLSGCFAIFEASNNE